MELQSWTESWKMKQQIQPPPPSLPIMDETAPFSHPCLQGRRYKVLCCRPKYWANIIHRYNDQNSLTSKCKENWALFERLTHSQRMALSVSPGAPGGVPNPKPRKPALFGPVQGCVYKHLSAPWLTLEKISVSRGEAQPFGKFTPAERPGNSLW